MVDKIVVFLVGVFEIRLDYQQRTARLESLEAKGDNFYKFLFVAEVFKKI
jgi:hypothetical protein